MDPEKEALIRTLQELRHSVRKGNKNNVKNIINCFHQNLARNKQLLSELYTSGVRCTTQTDLILAACQNKKADILYYILKETDILAHLTDDSFDDTEVNKQRTEAIKQALTLEDFNMVEMLYDFWCGNLHWSGHNIKNIKMVENDSFDDTEVNKQRTEAIIQALTLEDFNMVEMLYDFWCGNLSGHNIKNIKMVENVLKNARVACSDYDDQLRANFHCLLTFNAFQREIYTELKGLNSSDITPKEMATTLLKVLRIYDEYSQIEKIREIQTGEEREQEIQDNINDESSTFYRNLEYIYYEVYFRKLDFNVALLILENLFILRNHLKSRFNKKEKYFNENPNMRILYKNAANTYEEIESAIYHFIYSTSEHWRLYLPEKRQIRIEEYTVIQEGIKKRTKLTLDLHKLYNAPVICLERESYKKSFEKLKIILDEHVIRDDPALNENSNKETLLNENYLRAVGYMRDHYSLIKIVYYIEAIEKTTDIDVVMVERVLHVVGEMLKSSDDSHHLSPSTQALLQTAISVETIRHLRKIRNFLSKVCEGKLSTRIDMANNQAPRFKKIKEELIMIKEIINPILDIFKSILAKSLLEKGWRLLEQRIEGLPDEAKFRVGEIYKIHKNELVLKSGNYYQKVWRPLGLTLQLLQEIPWIMQNKAKILTDIQLAKTDLNEKIARILPSLLPYATQILKLMIETIERINQYDSRVQISKNPDAKEIAEIRTILKTLKKKKESNKKDYGIMIKNLKIDLNKINDCIDHWESVKGMLSFCLTECELFAEHRLTDTPTVTDADLTLKKLEAIICAKEDSNFTCNCLILNKKDFGGIESLHKELHSTKIKPDAPRLVREKLISCLISRLDLLKQTLLYPPRISLSQLVQRFDHDVKFRITIEMILADIANVLAECNIRLMNKSSMLLRDINMGNVLDHGNPFLEVIGDIFNSHDLAVELLVKAMKFAKDVASIKALFDLFKGEMDYRTILAGDLLKMDDQQKLLYAQFKESLNWKSYALFTRYTIPKSQRS